MSCPMCGRRHHPGTTKGFTGMNLTCYKKWEKREKARIAAERKAGIAGTADDRRLITSPKCNNCPHTRGSHSHTGARCFGKGCTCIGFQNWTAPG